MSRIPYLDSLRGLAAISVAIFHFKVGATLNNSFTDNAGIMVDFFFVLSGFVISLNYQYKIRTWHDVYYFQVRRFLRLYPLHLLMLLVFLGIEVAKYIAQPEYNISLSAKPQRSYFDKIISFVANLFLVQNFTAGYASWNYPSWSISAEFYTYLLFAAITFLVGKKKNLILWVSIIISLVSFTLLYGQSMTLDKGFLRCIYSFFLGVICCNIYNLISLKIPNSFSYLISIICVYMITTLTSMWDIKAIFIPILYMLLILSLVLSPEENGLKTILNHKHLVRLGTLSYGIYMIHAAVWWMWTQILRFGFSVPIGVDREKNIILLIDNVFVANVCMVMGLIMIIYLAHISYTRLEKPINAWRYKTYKISHSLTPPS